MSRQPGHGDEGHPGKTLSDQSSAKSERRAKTDREVMSFAYDRLGMPMLYADLMQFRKGPLRLQRLRTLVVQGLMAERAPACPAAPQTRTHPAAAGADEVFGEPIADNAE